ncbi:anti-sigma factor family protein [Paraclostridium bifermentans]|uniref:anti-sigma factor family protein n=1 Tax=Paraclostridium bifermentans TaxID=1490 RepID=UPI001898D322|nr:zf-HC2 domain-containing protein [Paraclostridium bifermentans]MDU3336847.1 zf-HC2 domain-containing protein [Paraclostridium bifermentans]
MKCYESGELQAYIDGELSLDMMGKVSKHLDECEVCQYKFNELVEVNDYRASLENQGDLQNKIYIEVAWDTFNSKLERKSKLNIIKGRFNNMNKMKKFSTVAAASLLIFIGCSGVAIATYNLFSQHVLEDDVVNKGLVREDGSAVDSTKEGKFKPLDIKIKDKDIIVHLTGLYVAESRVSVNYKIETVNGNLVPIEYDTEGLELKSDGIVDGKQVEAPEAYVGKEIYEGKEVDKVSQLQFLESKDGLTFELKKENKSLEIGIRQVGAENEGTITFAGFNPIDYPVNLDINIGKIGKVSGSWTGQVEIKS